MKVAIIPITLAILILKERHVDGVFNGRVAAIGDLPYMAGLCRVRVPFCGGAIIGERYVLTAGHCLYEKTEKNHNVMVGASSILDPRMLYFPVKHFHIHPDYYNGEDDGDSTAAKGAAMEEPMDHDIGVVEIWDEFPLYLPVHKLENQSPLLYELEKSKIAVDKIPYATGFVGQCVPCVFAGWGSISSASVDKYSFQLISTRLYISKCDACLRQECRNDPNTFCVHDGRNVATPGSGDSGGPLVCNGVVAGILSVAVFDARFATRFTNVALYETFIESIVPPLTKL